MLDAVLDWIFSRSSPVVSSGAFRFLQSATNLRLLPFADPAILEELQRAFTTEQLAAARVLIRLGDNPLALNPILAGAGARGLFLRLTKDDCPFDVVNQRGSLANDVPPAFDCPRDFDTAARSGRGKLVFAACSDEDLGVFQMLGLPSTPAAGLATMCGRQLRALFPPSPASAAQAANPHHTAPIATGEIRLLVIACHLAELKLAPPAEIAAIVKRLLTAEKAFEIETSERVLLWCPTPRDFERICAAVELQDRARIRTLLWNSISRSTRSAQEYAATAASRNPQGYGAARDELREMLAGARTRGVGSADIAKQLESLNRSFDAHIVEAIVQDAMSVANPVERVLLLAAADLIGSWHKSSFLVRAAQGGVDGRPHLREEPLTREEFKEQFRIVDGLVKIHRELTRSK
ncbi:hypothetical protein [Planctomicrobium piriforme]|uniref:Uncharacterized protein n=1 Tax=Planctomicrobium piriforme TaxID=1576369 RepID=A0A1I3R7A5_9PLAN|nr:hypothetical protein [Planctomicrobium piriforme]SFJ41920.1 hypothetical protein SAMN05421753_12021 [Planctomicrobium piriforme]